MDDSQVIMGIAITIVVMAVIVVAWGLTR